LETFLDKCINKEKNPEIKQQYQNLKQERQDAFEAKAKSLKFWDELDIIPIVYHK